MKAMAMPEATRSSTRDGAKRIDNRKRDKARKNDTAALDLRHQRRRKWCADRKGNRRGADDEPGLSDRDAEISGNVG
jgi:hypothetical protein